MRGLVSSSTTNTLAIIYLPRLCFCHPPFLQFYYSDDYNTDDVITYKQQEQDSYTKTDFRVIWNSVNENMEAEAFVENIEDEEVLARTNTGGFDLVQTSYAYPRNYGVKFSYNF